MNPIYTITPSLAVTLTAPFHVHVRQDKRFPLSLFTYSYVTRLSGYNAVIYVQRSDMSYGYRSEVCA
jgi:hypothetical protein